MTAIRLVVALLGAAFIVLFDYYFYFDEAGDAPVEPPGGRHFWFHSTAGEWLIPSVVVVVGAVVARWWVLGVAGVLAVAELVWTAFGRPGDFGALQPPTKDALEVFVLVVFFALLLALGVGAGKVVRSAASKFREAT